MDPEDTIQVSKEGKQPIDKNACEPTQRPAWENSPKGELEVCMP